MTDFDGWDVDDSGRWAHATPGVPRPGSPAPRIDPPDAPPAWWWDDTPDQELKDEDGR